MNEPVPISCIVTAFRRVDALLRTLAVIDACVPRPAEILVHVDGGELPTRDAVAARFPNVKILLSMKSLGPGGSRNLLLQAAGHDWVANFDDDAYPVSPDYFAQVLEIVRVNPEVAIISASSLPENWEGQSPRPISVYSGYACIFNRQWFLRTQGFVPLPFAYCMEEVDLGVRLHVMGGVMLHDPRLRVIHDMVVRSPGKVFHAQVLANIALFAFLRYPPWLLGIGVFQVMRRVVWLLKICPAAIPGGLAMIPVHLFQHRQWRKPVSAKSLISWFRLGRN